MTLAFRARMENAGEQTANERTRKSGIMDPGSRLYGGIAAWGMPRETEKADSRVTEETVPGKRKRNQIIRAVCACADGFHALIIRESKCVQNHS